MQIALAFPDRIIDPTRMDLVNIRHFQDMQLQPSGLPEWSAGVGRQLYLLQNAVRVPEQLAGYQTLLRESRDALSDFLDSSRLQELEQYLENLQDDFINQLPEVRAKAELMTNISDAHMNLTPKYGPTLAGCDAIGAAAAQATVVLDEFYLNSLNASVPARAYAAEVVTALAGDGIFFAANITVRTSRVRDVMRSLDSKNREDLIASVEGALDDLELYDQVSAAAWRVGQALSTEALGSVLEFEKAMNFRAVCCARPA